MRRGQRKSLRQEIRGREAIHGERGAMGGIYKREGVKGAGVTVGWRVSRY